MVWRIGARLHAFVHGLVKPSEGELVRQSWDELADLFQRVGIAQPAGLAHLIAALTDAVRERLEIKADQEQAEPIHTLIADLFEYEGLFRLPEVDWAEARTIAALWDIRCGP